MDQIINAFLTPAILGTFAGAVVATILFVQLLKELPLINRIPTRIFSYFIALIVLLVVTVVFSQPITVGSIVLCFFNALVVSLAAQGGFDLFVGGAKTSKSITFATSVDNAISVDDVASSITKSSSAAAKVQTDIKPPNLS